MVPFFRRGHILMGGWNSQGEMRGQLGCREEVPKKFGCAVPFSLTNRFHKRFSKSRQVIAQILNSIEVRIQVVRPLRDSLDHYHSVRQYAPPSDPIHNAEQVYNDLVSFLFQFSSVQKANT